MFFPCFLNLPDILVGKQAAFHPVIPPGNGEQLAFVFLKCLSANANNPANLQEGVKVLGFVVVVMAVPAMVFLSLLP